jgi:diacylglycerol kinase (ATP)
MTTRVLLVYNPKAGHANPIGRLNPIANQLPQTDVIKAVVRTWGEAGWSVAVQATNGPGHATLLARAAAARNYDLVAAVGGDGTVNEVVNGLAGSTTALVALPYGTVNVWVRELDLPVQPIAAAQALIDGEIRRVDLGRANGHYFLLMAGIGIDATVASEVRNEEKRRFGVLAYVLRMVGKLGSYRGTRAVISLDGRRIKGRVLQVVVGNSRLYAGVLQVTHQALIDDGMLDVCVIKGNYLYRLPLHTLAILLRRHTLNPELEYYRARSINIVTSTPLAVQVDGEAIGHTPLAVEVVPQALRVLIPLRAANELFLTTQSLSKRPLGALDQQFRLLPWPLGSR